MVKVVKKAINLEVNSLFTFHLRHIRIKRPATGGIRKCLQNILKLCLVEDNRAMEFVVKIIEPTLL